MARITWQNVTAPDFSGATQNRALAADLFGKAAQSIGGAFTDLDQNVDGKLSAAATERVMQIQDPDAWAKMMASGGISSLGISPDRASSALTELVAGRGAALQSQQDANYSREQTMLAAGRAEDDRMLGEQANELADKIAYGEFSPEEARAAVIRSTEGNVKLREATLAQLDQTDKSAWAVDPGMRLPDSVDKVLTGINRTVKERDSELAFQIGGNSALGFLNEGLKLSANGGDALGTLANKMTSATTLDGEEKVAAYDENMGSLTDSMNTLKAKFPGMSPEIIAAAMGQSLESNGWIWSGDKAQIAMDATEKLLTSINTPENRQLLMNEGNRIESEKSNNSAITERASFLGNRLAHVMSKGTPEALEEAERIELELSSILESMGGSAGSGSTGSGFSMGVELPGAVPGVTPMDPLAAAAAGITLDKATDVPMAQTPPRADTPFAPLPGPGVLLDDTGRPPRADAPMTTEPVAPQAPRIKTGVEPAILNVAVRDPANTARAVLAETSLSAAEMATAEIAISALERGGLSDTERKEAKMRLGDIMRKVFEDNLLINEDPAARGLLDNWDKWLKIGN